MPTLFPLFLSSTVIHSLILTQSIKWIFLALVDELYQCFDGSSVRALTSLDLLAALDKIEHAVLVNFLATLVVGRTFFHWFSCFLTNYAMR